MHISCCWRVGVAKSEIRITKSEKEKRFFADHQWPIALGGDSGDREVRGQGCFFGSLFWFPISALRLAHSTNDLVNRVGVAAERFPSVRSVHNQIRDGATASFQKLF